MKKCSRCGSEYDKNDVNFLFADVNRVPVDMCEECLERAYDDGEEGLFFDTCEECGKDFDVISEKSIYDSNVPWEDGVGFEGWGRVLCAACALEERQKLIDDPEEFNEN